MPLILAVDNVLYSKYSALALDLPALVVLIYELTFTVGCG